MTYAPTELNGQAPDRRGVADTAQPGPMGLLSTDEAQQRPDSAHAASAPLSDTRRTARDTAYEIDLDEVPPEDDGTPAPVDLPDSAVPLPEPMGARHPIIPNGLRWRNLPGTVRVTAGRWAYVAAFHTVRAPWYAMLAAVWAIVGVFRLAGRQLRWWWVNEQYGLLQQAASDNDPAMWLKLHREGKATRRWRGVALFGQTFALTFAVLAVAGLPVRWQVGIGAVLVPVLARYGRPAGRPIIPAAMVTTRYRRLNSDIVLRAYYAAGLGHPDRPHQQIKFGSQMARDAGGTGSEVLIDLPYGKTFDDAVKARGAIASGLDVTEQQVYLTRDTTSNRRHKLFVADRDPLAIPAGRTPLLDGKPRNIWQPATFGLDERGRKVTLLLLWISILVGAQPRKGKTFAARLLALYAAMDPYVTLTVVDGKDSPDWRKFALVAHRIVFGTVPNRDGDPVEMLLDALREIKAHIQQVNQFLSDLPVTECPEGKLTEELSRKYPNLRVWLLVMEEFQVYYELDDQEKNKEVAALLSFIMAVGPSSGVIIISSSQKPSGVGAGDVQRLFSRYRDNHAVRFALKCGNRNVSEAVLGGDAYSEGFDASSLPVGKQYRGVGYLYGASDETPCVRTYLADAEDAEKILTTARALRERAGTLTGYAAGQNVVREVRDVLADVLTVFQGETGLSWTLLAARLADRIPEHYADLTPDAISAQLRGLGVPSVDIKRDGKALKGAKKASITAAINRRQASAE
ncbi:cell division protein FtsK [Acrocarpospora pleiomorpha]|uniref:Cell division protein FtsK n=1 Tax=Acrocarpospora pleiomorpha TaxID=90975 RepID=A0A5M3XYC0_9ACTN|nr:cell division protein FtsK [Acrocarpospora pleiomorpha]GES24463.1 cell division protein FtsK [Acrocarpospora pleiomorpha]